LGIECPVAEQWQLEEMSDDTYCRSHPSYRDGRVALVMLPKHGRPNRWATAPILQALIPIVIVGMFGIGLILTIFGI
jgi:hypothetical protein